MSEPYLGQIKQFGFAWVPEHYALCSGETINVDENQALYSILGNQFGGDGFRDFKLPDLRGRTPVGADKTHYLQGQCGGAEYVTLTEKEMPTHTHRLMGSREEGDCATPEKHVLAKPVLRRGGSSVSIYARPNPLVMISSDLIRTSRVGSGSSHNNCQPSLVVNYAIALSGIYPCRD